MTVKVCIIMTRNIAAGIQCSLEILWIDIRSLEWDPDERPEAVSRHHYAAHQALPGGGEPLLSGANDGRVDKREPEAVEAEAGDGEAEVEAGRDEGQHEARAVQQAADGY